MMIIILIIFKNARNRKNKSKILQSAKNPNNFFSTSFEPCILAVISSDVASYPTSPMKFNLSYPPFKTSKASSVN